MAELVKPDRVKSYLEIADTDASHDRLLQELNKRLSAWVEQYCDRTFAKATYTEQHDGDGSDTLAVRHWPLLSVASLYDDPERAFPASTQIAAADFVVYPSRGLIKLDGLAFSAGIQNVKVTYDAGYQEIPEDLQQAVCELIADRFRHRDDQGLRSLTIGAYSATYADEAIPEETRMILNSYRRSGVR